MSMLYLIATPSDFPTLKGRALLYTLRGIVYASPLTPEGQLDVGAAIVVREEDVEELLRKSTYRARSGELRNVWTRSQSEAALRTEAYLKGEDYVPPAGSLDDAEIRQMAVAQLSDEELLKILQERGVAVEPATLEKKKSPGRKAMPPQEFRPPPITAGTPSTTPEED